MKLTRRILRGSLQEMLEVVALVGSRYTFLSYEFVPMAIDDLNRRGSFQEIPSKGVGYNLVILFATEWYRASSEGSLRDCHPTLTYVNFKSLIITITY